MHVVENNDDLRFDSLERDIIQTLQT